MADYPSALAIATGSGEKWRDPLLKSYSLSGSFKGRRLQSAKNKSFEIVHKYLTTAERDTLETFYNANRSITFNFSWPDIPATVYVCMFSSDSGLNWVRSSPYHWDVTVAIEVV